MSSRSERRKLLKILKSKIKKWRKILFIDPIWEIEINILDAEIMENSLARVDFTEEDYFRIFIDVNESILKYSDEEIDQIANRVACHELIHSVSSDFQRIAMVAVRKNKQLMEELRFRYEQFTTRLEKAFLKMDKELKNV